MMSTKKPKNACGREAIFKHLRLVFRQRCQGCGINLGSLKHVGVRVVIDPFPLTVRDRKNGKRGHWNRGVFLHARHNCCVSWEVALLANPSVWGRIPPLAEFRLGVSESQNSEIVSLERTKTGQVGFTWRRRLRPAEILKL